MSDLVPAERALARALARQPSIDHDFADDLQRAIDRRRHRRAVAGLVVVVTVLLAWQVAHRQPRPTPEPIAPPPPGCPARAYLMAVEPDGTMRALTPSSAVYDGPRQLALRIDSPEARFFAVFMSVRLRPNDGRVPEWTEVHREWLWPPETSAPVASLISWNDDLRFELPAPLGLGLPDGDPRGQDLYDVDIWMECFDAPVDLTPIRHPRLLPMPNMRPDEPFDTALKGRWRFMFPQWPLAGHGTWPNDLHGAHYKYDYGGPYDIEDILDVFVDGRPDPDAISVPILRH